MFPATYFRHFPAFPSSDKAFVVMSFSAGSTPRWERVMRPAIEAAGLQPVRADTRTVSDSILTDILSGIATARLVLADISIAGASRNGNVMYEVGLAHAMRLPEEVLLFRSDKEKLLFDVAAIRVREYDPDHNQDDAREQVRVSIVDALREVDLTRHLAVRRATSALDYSALAVLTESDGAKAIANQYGISNWHFVLPEIARADEGRRATIHLLELGLLCTEYLPSRSRDGSPTPWGSLDFGNRPLKEILRYRLTALGEAVLHDIARRFLGRTRHERVVP
jgi:hypothetical protein